MCVKRSTPSRAETYRSKRVCASRRMRAARCAAWAVAVGIAVVAGANPYAHLRGILPPVERLARRYAMPDVSAVTDTDLAGAFSMPVRVPVAVADVRRPGVPRDYRHGIHQGADFYGIPAGKPVYPVAAGIIIRVDRVYMPMSGAYRNQLLARCQELGATPGSFGVPPDFVYGDILDKLRGRQVWVYHGRNAQREPILSIYGHLRSVENLPVGTYVTPEQEIGTVGKSGTSMEGTRDDTEVHLHLEVIVGLSYWRLSPADGASAAQAPDPELELRAATLRALGGIPELAAVAETISQRTQ
ncbi:M23 family metallopeptidase [Candidatus Poribacteria bacterium]|nr:M23 family metallopeptidase [Candidatus Poribacteria bacterium]